MRQVAQHNLWIGNANDLHDPRALLTAGIEAIVELEYGRFATVLPRDLVHCRFPLWDGGENPEWLVRLAVDTVTALLAAQTPVIVCCGYGLSRSVCVAAGALAIVSRQPLDGALGVVAGTGPADVSPGLWNVVRRVVAGQPQSD